MAFWCRIRYSKLNSLSSRLRRSYFQVPDIKLVNSISGRNITQVSRKTNPFFRHRSSEVYDTVRFFAAPVQAKPKVEARGPKGPRINEQITSKFIRLVVDEGHAIVSRHEALERAKKLKLDLVEVQRDANPPVCKIIDYHREKYKKQVKEKERSKAKSEVTLRKGDCKEVRFSGKTEQKDLQMKADMVKRLMEKGYRVRCMAMGTEDQDLGGLLARLSALIEEFAFVESGPRVERRQAYVIVRHIKFGPSKKGSSKKATNTVGTTGNVVPEATIVPATLNSAGSIPSAELIEDESSESGLETEDKFFIDEADSSADSPINTADRDNEANNTAWSLFDDGDEFEKVFDFDNNQNGVGLSAADGTMDGAAVTTAQQENVDAAALHPKPVPGTIRSPEPLLGGESGYRSSNPVSRLQPNSIKSSSPESHLFSGSFTSSLGQNSNVTRGSGVVDIGRVGSQVPNQGNHGWQRQTVSDISPTAEHKQFGIKGSFRKEKFPSTDETQKHTDLRRVGLQFTSQGNQGRQQQPILNNSPSEQKQFGIDASSKNVQHPSTDETQKHTEPGGVGPQFTIHGNQGRQQQPIWNNSPSEQKEFGINASSKNVQHPSTDAAQKHGSSQPCSPTSPAPGYGIFSTSEPTTPRKENAGMDVKVDPRKSKHLSENPPDLKPPTSNVENRQRSDASTSRPGGWGVFSKEGSSVNNSRVSDTEIRAER